MSFRGSRTTLFFLLGFTLASFAFAVPHSVPQKPRRDPPLEPFHPSLRPDKPAMRTLIATGGDQELQKDVIPPSPSPSPAPDACWQRNKQSISYRSGDCMPYHFTSYTKRVHVHYIGSNEVVSGKCGTVTSSKVENDGDLGWTYTYDAKAKKVTAELRNYGGRFCFGDRDFGAGCVVDRYVC